jgi:hypothetical protein
MKIALIKQKENSEEPSILSSTSFLVLFIAMIEARGGTV